MKQKKAGTIKNQERTIKEYNIWHQDMEIVNWYKDDGNVYGISREKKVIISLFNYLIPSNTFIIRIRCSNVKFTIFVIFPLHESTLYQGIFYLKT